MPSVAGTGTGAASTRPTNGVATGGSGPRMGPEPVGGDGEAVDAAGGSDEVAQPATTSTTAADHAATVVRDPMSRFAIRYGSGSGRASESAAGLRDSSVLTPVAASGSTSTSVRNMKKNTTQPSAAMKIQLINR